MTIKLNDCVLVVDECGERLALVSAIWPDGDRPPRLNLVVVSDLGHKERNDPCAQVGRVDAFTAVAHSSAMTSSDGFRCWRQRP